MANSRSWDFHVRHFSQPRLAHYLTACADDHSSATALYEWNSTIGAAFWEALGHLEVAMRNSIDRRMDETGRKADQTIGSSIRHAYSGATHAVQACTSIHTSTPTRPSVACTATGCRSTPGK